MDENTKCHLTNIKRICIKAKNYLSSLFCFEQHKINKSMSVSIVKIVCMCDICIYIYMRVCTRACVLLAADQQVLGSILGTTRLSEK
jgi:hypothetical protein